MQRTSYAILALTAALTACGGGGGSGDDPAPVTASAEGFWEGTTGNGDDFVGVVLDDGRYYMLYANSATELAGIVQGTGSVSGTSFSSSDARDFNFTTSSFTVYDATVSASFTPKEKFDGNISYASSVVSFTATYDDSYETPLDSAEIAGSYSGTALSAAGSQSTTITLGTNGNFTGTVSGCNFTGTLVPHGQVAVLDLSVTFQGGVCYFGTATLSGIGLYDHDSGQLVAMAPNADRDEGFLIYASKPL